VLATNLPHQVTPHTVPSLKPPRRESPSKLRHCASSPNPYLYAAAFLLFVCLLATGRKVLTHSAPTGPPVSAQTRWPNLFSNCAVLGFAPVCEVIRTLLGDNSTRAGKEGVRDSAVVPARTRSFA